MARIGVIGAGLAGLACAAALHAAGHRVFVHDKGRGPGGRLATRRTVHGAFDHGAPGVAARGAAFAAWLGDAAAAGHAQRDAGGEWVGLPGMSGLVRPLLAGLALTTEATVTGIARDADGWHLTGPGIAPAPALAALVLAVPQPDALRLLAPFPEEAALIDGVAMRPQWTALYAFDGPLPAAGPRLAGPAGHPVATAIRQADRPGRAPGERWVVHAAPDWSAAELERDRPEAAALLLAPFLALAGAKGAVPALAAGHRWRHALTARPLGRPCLWNPALGLGLCGDWCLGTAAEDAWASGRALAATVAATLQPA
jgi:predicted NAD/FAD-dependent oxidoreductase